MTSETDTTDIRLGLIGDNIARSRSPLLHVEAGRLCGLRVSYERLVPADMGLPFDAVFERCRQGGFHGINVTYPYKEQVVPLVRIDAAVVSRMGACNTVLFSGNDAEGFNTDYSGFVTAYRSVFGERETGTVAMAGAGGVGKAIAFALAALECSRVRLYDPNTERATALAQSIGAADTGMVVEVCGSIGEAADGADGLVNCTPLGMAGQPGTAVPAALMDNAAWAFDAVYTPVETEFLERARATNLEVMSGYELYFHQGVDAFRLFTGRQVDQTALRGVLAMRETERVHP
ncbi:MAG TPA: shikimate dehydrogenase [Aestuariivirgaceae bacterium]|nr:shikimate dehydrogenase [Aestuariivirgaceae bacterium]